MQPVTPRRTQPARGGSNRARGGSNRGGLRRLSALRYTAERRLSAGLMLLLAPFLAAIPLLLDDPGRVPHLGQRGPHIAAVDEVVMPGAEEFRGEGPQAAGGGDTARAARAQHA